MNKFKFIVIEGIDGSGKTSLRKSLADYLRKAGSEVYEFYEPGSTKVGEEVRTLVKEGPVHPRVTHLLIEAGRLDLLLKIQALKEESQDRVFLVDRHVDSSWAYQGAAGVNGDYINLVQSTYVDLPIPDITIFLDIDPDKAISRISYRNIPGNNIDFFDSQGVEYFTSVRNKYWERINKNPSQYIVIDGAQPKLEIVNQVIKFLT